MRIHSDWRSRIVTRIRSKHPKATGPYVESGLDRFQHILPYLSLEKEVYFQRQKIVDIVKRETGEDWSKSSAGKFLDYLVVAKVIYKRLAGPSKGIAIRLREELDKSPWSSRRSDGTTPKSYTRPSRVGTVKEEADPEPDPEPEQEPTVKTPIEAETPQDVEYDDNDRVLDLDSLLNAHDALHETIKSIDLDFADQLPATSPKLTGRVYAAQASVLTALQQLARIKEAILYGTSDDLENLGG